MNDKKVPQQSPITKQRSEAIPAIEIKNLGKKYPSSDVYAVKDFNMVVRPGEIVGLLGHNGAGKSTTLKCLTGMLPFGEGSIKINGFNIKTEPVRAKSTFGFVSDRHDVFVKMTGLEYLAFMANAYGVDEQTRLKRIQYLDKVFPLGERLLDPISDYSHGMRQKICMMGSVIHKPKLWILDEPMIGLDPLTSAKVAAFMKEYAKNGNAILFSSHNINSVEKICERAVIIQGGQKTDDFVIKEFVRQNPGVDLEKYFLKKTTLRTVRKDTK